MSPPEASRAKAEQSTTEADESTDPSPASHSEISDAEGTATGEPTTAGAKGFLPTSPPRFSIESVFARLIATAGVVGIGTAMGAILIANNVAGWISGLVVSAISVVLAAVLWRSRQL